MKKQIFTFVLLVMATFASVSKSYGQTAVTGSAPRPLPATCTGDALHPIAGKPYDYTAIINPALGTTYWYATKSTTFITAGGITATEIPADGVNIVSTATNYRTSVTGATATSPTTTNVTWTSAGLFGVNATTNPLFMVLNYTSPDCSNNMKVYQIVPKNAFTVDIRNMNHTTQASLSYDDATEVQCYANVAGATWSSGTGMTFDYGVNTMYFEVVAANFTTSFTPTFRLSGLKTGQTAVITWDYARNGTYSTAIGGTLTGVTGTPLTTASTTVLTSQTNTTAGVSMYVKVTISNGRYEGLSNDPISLAVEAVDASTNKDVDHTDCSLMTAYDDVATQTLNSRPTVTAGALMPAPGLVNQVAP